MFISLSLICKRVYITHNLQLHVQISNQEPVGGYATTHNHPIRDTPSNQGVSLHQLQPINYLYVPFAKSSCCLPCATLITNLQDATTIDEFP